MSKERQNKPLGAKFFNPQKTNQYRLFAYIIIATAAISGLPVWD